MPLYYLDKNGNQQDKDIHNRILAEGDEEAALSVSREVEQELLKQKPKRHRPPAWLENGWFVDEYHHVFIIIRGDMERVYEPGDELEFLEPGYYDKNLNYLGPPEGEW